jgi:hypothetical protein
MECIGLGLFMIEAADAVINGQMSLCVIKPFPLQYEEQGPDPVLPPAAEAKLRAHYTRIGFAPCPNGSKWMMRWNGRQHPDIRDLTKQ